MLNDNIKKAKRNLIHEIITIYEKVCLTESFP